MEGLGKARSLHGTDIDPDAIDWCRTHIPFANVSVNDADPPLPYAEGAFDLVFNHSVFTHIDERRQDAWLSELHRVTRPGAFLVLSTHGEVALPDNAWTMRDRLERDGIAFMDQTFERDFPLPDWYQNTWHAPWYVFEHWARWFDIRAYAPGGSLDYQDHVLLQRAADDVPRRIPIGARPQLPAPGAPESRVAAALAAARRLRQRDPGHPTYLGKARGLARALVLRSIRPYSLHEDNFDEAVATSIADLDHALQQHNARLEDLERNVDSRD